MPRPKRRAARTTALASALAVLTAAVPCAAQQAARPQPAVRLDAIDVRSASRGTLQAGAGIGVPLGYYVRMDVVGAGGATRVSDTTRGSARLDLVARFLLDPFRENRWGLSVGGGVSEQYVEDARWRTFLLVLLDLEAPRVGTVVPAGQLGLGGGVRVGVLLRRYQAGRR